ncbi:MAG TPA: glycosyltransferase [Acidobacteriota bacterium]
MPKKLLFLSAHTGNGHNAAAAALAEAIRAQGEDVEIAHPIEQSGSLNRSLAGTYDWALKNYPGRMHWYFQAVNRLRPDRRLLRFRRVQSKGLDFLRRHNPKMVVSFHPMTNHPFALLCGLMDPPVPVACVVTDPFPPFWEGWKCRKIQQFFVATEEAAAELRAAGVGGERILVTGLPVAGRFEEGNRAPAEWYIQNGLRPGKFTLFLNAGWLGGDDFIQFYRAIAKSALPLQVIYVHGASGASEAARIAAGSNAPTLLMPRTDRMHQWMRMSDLMITKPGALTIYEALACELPVGVNAASSIMPQERGMAEAIRSRGLGLWIGSAAELLQSVRGLSECRDKLHQFRVNIRKFYRPGAAGRIAHRIAELAEEPAREMVGAWNLERIAQRRDSVGAA